MSRYKKAVALATLLACSGLIASDAMAQKRGPAWSELGCRKVSFIGKDRDVIKVGRKEGRFRAIRLKARGNDVEMLDLKVVYANGAPDDIPVRKHIRAGSQTGPLDLKGRDRAIDSVEMVYKSRPNFKGLATVCVDGLQS
jgi:Protein of unknown function (DUF2541)